MAEKLRILVMDDEISIRKALSIIMSMSGYDCLTAIDGNEALQVYKKSQEEKIPILAVILDLNVDVGMMPGKEAAQELLKIDKNVKLVASSGDSQDDVIINYKKYGFGNVLIKPYDIEQLKALLENLSKEEKKP
jgi:two-component system cell cycle sensor histidine kinase/response regulator CckA